jgi:KDEL-tailed cysteine endopeptidase
MKAAVALLVAVAALALVATVQAGFYFTAEDLESDEALWELYGRWAAHHGVVREPGRFPTFKANAHMLHGKQRHADELMALNVFGDWSFDEVHVVRGEPLSHGAGVTRHRPRPPRRHARSPQRSKSTGGLQMLSLLSRTRVSATAAAVEGRQAIRSKSAAVSLSAQFLLDCTYPTRTSTTEVRVRVPSIPGVSGHLRHWQVSLVRQIIGLV